MHSPFSKKTEKLRTCLENTEEDITHPEYNALLKKFKVTMYTLEDSEAHITGPYHRDNEIDTKL